MNDLNFIAINIQLIGLSFGVVLKENNLAMYYSKRLPLLAQTVHNVHCCEKKVGAKQEITTAVSAKFVGLVYCQITPKAFYILDGFKFQYL